MSEFHYITEITPTYWRVCRHNMGVIGTLDVHITHYHVTNLQGEEIGVVDTKEEACKLLDMEPNIEDIERQTALQPSFTNPPKSSFQKKLDYGFYLLGD